jgi:hypothetical protein
MATALTEQASIGCGHSGTVQLAAGQATLVSGAAVLVAGDLDGRPIAGCTTAGPGLVPCTAVLSVIGGTAARLSAGGRAVLLDTVSGMTNGNPTGTLTVLTPGQRELTAD